MAGGSQLKALKATLKSHGLIGQTNTKGKGKGKKGNDRNRQDKEKVLENIRKAFSPFDVKTTKQKNDVIGRKVIGAVGRPGVSNQAGEESRKNAYLVEKAMKNRVGNFMDRRFGENDPSLNPEDKMLERFTKERQNKASKGSLFSLEDGEDYSEGMGEDLLTHAGRALELNDDFDEGDLGISEDDEESKRELDEIRKKRKRLADGEDLQEEEKAPVKKSREEIMKEVIAKSKMHKYERQQAAKEDQDEIDKLDDKDAFSELLGELRNAGSFGAKNDLVKNDEEEEEEEYEQQVRMLAFDRRAKPSDRTKTEEEIAREKAAKLQDLERKRIARMNGEISEDDESESEEEAISNTKADQPEYGNEDIEINDASAFGLKADLNEGKLSDEEEEDDDLNGNYEVDDEFHQFSEDEEATELPTDKLSRSVEKEKKGISSSKTAFTFNSPEDVSDLINIFAKSPASEYPVIVERILTLYHPSLDKDNKEKNSVFANVLAEYLLQVSDEKPTDESKDISPVFSKLLSQLQALAEKHTESLSEFLREKLSEADVKLQKSIASTKTSGIKEVCKPSYLLLFTLIGILFSTSDHFHQIVTPASLLIGQHLSQNKVNSLNDIYAGLYLCSNMLRYQRISNRYIPEVIQFLAKSLAMLSPDSVTSLPRDILISQVESDDVSSKAYRKFATTHKDVSKLENKPLALRDILSLKKTDTLASARLYRETCRLISAFLSLWNEKLAVIEMFSSFETPLTITDDEATAQKLGRLLKFARQSREPLALQSHRPIPIPSNVPKFEEHYSLDKKSYDPDTARQEISKLKNSIKKERKGALREIRKDSKFIGRQKIDERRASDKAYHEKMARLVNTVATEEGAEKNKYEREREARKRKNKKR